MNEDRVWAPWRLDYVSGRTASDAEPPLPEPLAWHAGADHHCFLCRGAAKYDETTHDDRRLLVADRRALTVVALNRYPYNNGHLLVAPRRHVGELIDLTRDEHVECLDQLVRFTRIYQQRLNADGFNIGLNLGNSILHSGTVAAARQAVLLGMRGIALSAPSGAEPDFEPYKPWVRRVLDTLLDEPGLLLVNVNLPREPRGLVWTRASVRRYDGQIVVKDGYIPMPAAMAEKTLAKLGIK